MTRRRRRRRRRRRCGCCRWIFASVSRISTEHLVYRASSWPLLLLLYSSSGYVPCLRSSDFTICQPTCFFVQQSVCIMFYREPSQSTSSVVLVCTYFLSILPRSSTSMDTEDRVRV